MRTMVGQAADSGLIQATLSAGKYSNLGKSAATPGAFGNTQPHPIIALNSPWWTGRPAQLGLLATVGCALIITLVIILGSDDTSIGADSQVPAAAASAQAELAEVPKDEHPAAVATEIEKPSDKPSVPDSASSVVPEEKSPSAQPRPVHRPPVVPTAPAPRVVPAPAPRVTPAPTPPAPAPEPKRRVDFGY